MASLSVCGVSELEASLALQSSLLNVGPAGRQLARRKPQVLNVRSRAHSDRGMMRSSQQMAALTRGQVGGIRAASRRLMSKRGSELKAQSKEDGAPAADVDTTPATDVAAVLFDMDGVLCDSEDPSRAAAVELFSDLYGLTVTAEDFVPFMGTGEANFLGGVARVYGVTDFDATAAKKRFFEIYIEKYAKPESGIGYPGAKQLVEECKAAGLKVAVASSADRVKVDANLRAAGLPVELFDAIVSADKFENLKPAPDIFLAAAKALGVETKKCVVIEDALAGVQAAGAAAMRCIAVTTTLSEEKLLAAQPTLVRADISRIELQDILTLKYPDDTDQSGGNADAAEGGSSSEESSSAVFSTSVAAAAVPVATAAASAATADTAAVFNFWDDVINLPFGVSTSRRSVLRAASLGAALTTTAFALDNLQAFSYVSPKAILNIITGVATPPALADDGKRVSKLKKYIADVERSTSSPIPDFESRLPWLNSAPLAFSRELKGKVVLLDFWTYCCINCMHVLPDLAFLEKKYENQPLVVVGVHSAKFDNEKDLEAIRSAVLRYDVKHPVVNDGEMSMWRALGVSSWPTLALISPEGKMLGMLAGEGNKQLFDDLIGAALEYYGERGLLDTSPIPLALEAEKDKRLLATPLKFPGKIATDLANGRIFISDSNNHRIVVTDLTGKFLFQVGGAGGEEGLRDGPFDSAAFNRPQGVAYDSSRDILFVADTENHALREVNFVTESVRTLAGNGTKGRDYRGGGKGEEQLLNSPWDVALDASNESVFIAIAGQHQIWRHSIASGVTEWFSGSGYERNQNGRTASDTAYAQPSGLSLSNDGSELFCADSESSSVRAVSLRTGGSRLCAGGDPNFAENLFKFGDRDGSGSRALLQHPLGVLVVPEEESVLVADSYNHKIKLLNLKSNEVKTIAGSGVPGFQDGAGPTAQFSEPAGFALGPGGTIFVADTNNSVIRTLDLSTSPIQVATLDLSSVPPPAAAVQSESATSSTGTRRRLRKRQPVEAELVALDEVKATSGKLLLQFTIPEGYHYTKGAVSRFEVDAGEDSGLSISPASGELKTSDLKSTAEIAFTKSGADPSTAKINCKVYYCQQDDVCLYKAVSFSLPISSSQSEDSVTVPVSFNVIPKQAQSPLAGALAAAR